MKYRGPQIFMTRQKATVDSQEMDHFAQFSNIWWNPNGSLKPLHRMNQIRISLIKNGLINIGAIDKNIISSPMPLIDKKILDVGCGGGILTEELAKHGGSIHGVDACEQLVKCANSHVKINSNVTNLKYFCSTIEDYVPHNFEYYDVVIASEVIEHVTEKEMFIKCCIKCLKPGGSMFITTFNKNFGSWLFNIVLAERVFKTIPPGTHTLDKFIKLKDLEMILQKYNCKTAGVKGTFFNCVTTNWSVINSDYFGYFLHAVKNKQQM
ncbi:hypothetical protein FQA39_LY04723 [Lamprigera yunnana]|nr:hypothetical protein FQA39_LY04723 [Lamprigera yunnana]